MILMKISPFKKVMSLALMTAMALSLAQPVAASMQDADRPRTTATSASTSSTKFETSTKYKYSKIKNSITKSQEENKDIKGWLIVPGTVINEPVAYSSKDNDYYLYRDKTGKNYPNITWENFASYPDGVLYLDFRTKIGTTWKSTSKNQVIYGHNWTNLRAPMAIGKNNNHRMFGQLPSYTNQKFAQNNPYIYYSTGENEGIWKVFCVAYCEVDASFNYNSPNPKTENFKKLISEWKARSMYDFGVEVDETDRLLTLSTCTRYYDGIGSKQRFVVVARLLREGESENDSVKVTVNSDMKKPKF